MTVPFDFYIQKEIIFSAGGQFYDFIQCGDVCIRELLAEEGSVIQVPDLVIGHFPYIFIEPGGPL